MRKLSTGFVLLMVLALVVPQAVAAEKNLAKRPAKKAAPPPAFALKNQDGKPVSLKDHAKKIVVLEWVNWECPFYKRHEVAGTMKTLATKYADKGVVWLGINSTKHHNVEKIKKWHKKAKIPYPVLDDHTGEVGRMFGAKTTPQIVILDKKHRLAYNGAIDDDPRGRKLKQGTAKNYADQALGELVAGEKVSLPRTKPYGCTVKYAPPRKKAPGFALKDHNGKEVCLADFAGKTVVLEWVNWECPFYKRHVVAGTMKGLATKYAGKGVVWLGINSTKHHNVERIKAWHASEKIPYQVLDDHEGTVGRKYGARTTPEMHIIDAKGYLIYSGAIDDDPRGKKLKQGTAKNYVDQVLTQVTAGKSVSFKQTRPYGCTVKYAKKKK